MTLITKIKLLQENGEILNNTLMKQNKAEVSSLVHCPMTHFAHFLKLTLVGKLASVCLMNLSTHLLLQILSSLIKKFKWKLSG